MFSYGSQKSESQSNQGLPAHWRSYYLDKSIPEFDYLQGRTRGYAQDPGGLRWQGDVDRLLPTGKYGLHPNLEGSTLQLGRDLFSNASSSRAMRGFNTPPSLEAVTGDAIRMASPQLANLQTQYALARAQMAPELQKLSFGYEQTPMQILQNLISGSGASSSSGSGFGFSASLYGGGGNPSKGGGG